MTDQKLSIVHAADSTFVADGMRKCFEYRDLGINAATDGNFHAHVIRAVDQEEDGIGLHRHNEIEFQMVYILKGWMRFWYEGEGEVIAREGTCILQPPKVKNDVLEWSDDLELLEITSPADFTSEALQAAE
ncbi:MAG: cupin domain-containing protein [Rhodospirillaceae bacterium]|nr:cupin domain-containing protein [Rhodospirillaceae bacterium]